MRALLVAATLLLLAPAARADSPPALVEDLLPGPASGSPNELTAFGNELYFTGGDPSGFGLFRSDGTDIALLKRTDAGGGFAVAGGTLFFSAHEPATGLELWSAAGLVRDLEPGATGAGPRSLTAVGSTLYFEAFTTLGQRALWRSDGTAANTVLVKTFPVNQPLRSLTAVGSLLFFVADDGAHGRELWRSDGTAAGTVMVSDIDPQSSSSPTMLTPFGGQLVFAATDPVHGTELWRSDGTTATLIKDIRAGPDGSSPSHAAALGGSLYFAAEDTRGRELWRTDGTTATLVSDIYPGAESSAPRWITAVGSRLLFEARDATNGRELWRSDGTTAALVRNINPAGDANVQPSGDGPAEHFTVAGGRAFFQADDGTAGLELWRSDGTSAALVGDINPGGAGSQPEEMTVAGDRLFFAADRAGTGTELWSLVLGPSADVAVALAANPPRPRPSDQATLTVTARNLGPEPTAGVRVRVNLPAGVTLASSPPGLANGVWTVGALASGAAKTLQLTLTVVGSSPVVSAQVIASDLTDDVPANNAASLVLAPPWIDVGGPCTLVLAIVAANTDAPAGGCPAGNGADLIVLAAGSTHALAAAYETAADGATGLPSITSDITIAGNGAIVRRAPGAGAFRFFRVPAGGRLTLRELTVRGGSATVRGGGMLVAGGIATLEDARVESSISPNGGGIAMTGGALRLTRAAVTDNTAVNGGAINTSGGSLTLVDSTISANRATHPSATTFGGGIYASAALSITGGAISGNSASDGGGLVTLGTATLAGVAVRSNTASFGFGGIDNRGRLTLVRGTVANNAAGAIGGGIGNLFSGIGELRMTGTTVSGNTATEAGGVASWGPAAITSSTISGNGLDNRAGTLTVEASTIVGGALAVSATTSVTGSIVGQCTGAPTDGGGNVGCFVAGVDPLLGPLADNGGPTLTHAPLPGSPAIDAGAAACPPLDQRGVARPLDGDGNGAAACDAGAVEAPAAAAIAQPGPPAPVAPLPKPTAGIKGVPRKLTAVRSTVALGTASNPPTAATTQTLTRVGGASAATVLARGSTRIPAGGKRKLTLKLTPAGKRAIKRKAIRVRLRIRATGPDGTRATLTRTLKLSRRAR